MTQPNRDLLTAQIGIEEGREVDQALQHRAGPGLDKFGGRVVPGEHPDRVALRWRNPDESWSEWTWQQYGDQVARVMRRHGIVAVEDACSAALELGFPNIASSAATWSAGLGRPWPSGKWTR